MTSCGECGEPFSLVFPAKRCGQCSRMVCSVCMTETVHIPNASKKGQGVDILVCDECYFTLRDTTIAIATPEKSCDERVTSALPRVWRDNFTTLWMHAWLSQVSMFPEAVCIAFNFLVVGHIGEVELCGTLLAYAVMCLTTVPFARAILTTTETIILKSLSKGDEITASIALQRCLVIVTVATVTMALLWQSSASCLRVFGVQDEVAFVALRCLRFYMAGVWQDHVFMSLAVYTHAHAVHGPVTVAGLVRIPLHIVINLMMVWRGGWGVAGMAMANALSKTISLGVLLVMFSRRALGAPAIPSLEFECFDWVGLVHTLRDSWSLFVGFFILSLSATMPTLLAANLNLDALTTHAAVTVLSCILVIGPSGIAAAVVLSLTHHLQTGKGSQARAIAWLGIFSSLGCGVFSAVLVLVLSLPLQYLFTHDTRAAHDLSLVIPLTALFQIWQSAGTVVEAVLVSICDTKFVVTARMTSIWVLLFPLALLLTVSAELELMGLWWSMVLATAVSTLVSTSRILGIKWTEVAQRAQKQSLCLAQMREEAGTGIDVCDVVGYPPHTARNFGIVAGEIDWDALEDGEGGASDVAGVDSLHMARKLAASTTTTPTPATASAAAASASAAAGSRPHHRPHNHHPPRSPAISTVNDASTTTTYMGGPPTESASGVALAVFSGVLQQPRRYSAIIALTYARVVGGAEGLPRLRELCGVVVERVKDKVLGRDHQRGSFVVVAEDEEDDDDGDSLMVGGKRVGKGILGSSTSSIAGSSSNNKSSNGYSSRANGNGSSSLVVGNGVFSHVDAGLDDIDLDYGGPDGDSGDEEEVAVLTGRTLPMRK